MSFKLNCTIPNFYNDVPTQWFRFIEKKIFLWYCRNRIFLATLGLKEASLFTILLESSLVLSTLLFVSVVLLFLRVFSRTACARNAGELRAHGLYSPHLFTRFSWVWTRRYTYSVIVCAFLWKLFICRRECDWLPWTREINSSTIIFNIVSLYWSVIFK